MTGILEVEWSTDFSNDFWDVGGLIIGTNRLVLRESDVFTMANFVTVVQEFRLFYQWVAAVGFGEVNIYNMRNPVSGTQAGEWRNIFEKYSLNNDSSLLEPLIQDAISFAVYYTGLARVV